jgi:hypothetical protein
MEQAHAVIVPIHYRQPCAVTSEPQAAGKIQLSVRLAWTSEAASQHANR